MRVLGTRVWPCLLAAATVGCDAGAAAVAGDAQYTSAFGHTYFSLADTTGALAEADSVLASGPADVDALLDAAAARVALWRYREAIELYDSAIAIDGHDWRPWRFRGHRHISLRDLDAAVRDLEHARQLDSLSFDVAYHLGLAHYLRGEWDLAAGAYARCMRLAEDPAALALNDSDALPAGYRACMDMATVDNDRVAMTEWRWRALRRAGRHQEARALLETIHPRMDVGTNASYYQLLLMHKGEQPQEAVFDTTQLAGNQFETIGYGVAVQQLTEGDTAAALALMRRIVERGERWQAFGFIGAEQDLIRLDGRPRAAGPGTR